MPKVGSQSRLVIRDSTFDINGEFSGAFIKKIASKFDFVQDLISIMNLKLILIICAFAGC